MHLECPIVSFEGIACCYDDVLLEEGGCALCEDQACGPDRLSSSLPIAVHCILLQMSSRIPERQANQTAHLLHSCRPLRDQFAPILLISIFFWRLATGPCFPEFYERRICLRYRQVVWCSTLPAREKRCGDLGS